MKYSVHFPVMITTLIFLIFSSTEGFSRDLPITLSDLEPAIRKLPEVQISDPVVTLEARLEKLRSTNTGTQEQEGLAQAVALIHILRATRITTATRTQHPSSNQLVAVSIGSKVPSDYRLSK